MLPFFDLNSSHWHSYYVQVISFFSSRFLHKYQVAQWIHVPLEMTKPIYFGKSKCKTNYAFTISLTSSIASKSFRLREMLMGRSIRCTEYGSRTTGSSWGEFKLSLNSRCSPSYFPGLYFLAPLVWKEQETHAIHLETSRSSHHEPHLNGSIIEVPT